MRGSRRWEGQEEELRRKSHAIIISMNEKEVEILSESNH